jgi:hypothetical protein
MTSIDDAAVWDTEDLVRAKQIVQLLRSDWDESSWNEFLADRIVLSVKPGKSRINQFDWFRIIGSNPYVAGRENVLRVLKGISVDLGSKLSATAKLVCDHDIVLLGDLAMQPEIGEIEAISEPVVLYVGLDEDGKIEKMMLAAIELRPLVKAILDVARSGASHRG